MYFPSPCRYLFYKLSQLPGRLYRALPDDAVGDPIAVPFFTVGLDQVGQPGLRGIIHDIGGGDLLPGIKAHIQRRVLLKAETATVTV
jgi:hypothetical protein